MPIDELLKKVQQIPPLGLEEKQKERAEVDEILKENQLSPPKGGFDLSVYEKLLPLTSLASQEEQSTLSKEEQKRGARLHAVKLAILFGGAEAIEYLKRYEKRYPNSKQLIHDACLFSLPEGDQWDVALWRGIIAHQNPSDPKDLIMRILPFAKQIEDYVNTNRNQLTEEIRQEITREYEQRFLQEYDEGTIDPQQFQQNWREKKLAEKKKVIEREINKQFDSYLRDQLTLPKGKLESTDLQNLKERKTHLTSEDLKKRNEIQAQIEDKYRQGIEREIKAELLSLANQGKQEYIRSQLEKTKGQIEAEVKDKAKNLLSATTSITDIRKYSRHAFYARANDNLEAAELFFSYGVKEKSFNKYLSLHLQDDPKLIPDLTIEGSTISPNYAEYYIKKLSPFDPRAAILGKLTSCCQSLGDVGEAPAIHGMTDPRGGFYVLCKKGIPDILLAQCWAWRSEDGCLVFDSIESQVNFRQKAALLITDFYTYLADALVKKHHVPRVLVGAGGETPENLGVLKPIMTSYPARYYAYRDSNKQRLIADEVLPPLVQVYRDENKTTALAQGTAPDMSRKAIEEWCDLCVINSKEDYMTYINPFMTKAGLNENDLKTRISQTKEWIDYLHRQGLSVDKDFFTKAKTFINDGVNPNIPAENGHTALHYAARFGHLDVVKWLVEKGAEVNAKDWEGRTALHYAAHFGHLDVVKWLVEKGVEVNAKDKDDETALHEAAHFGHLDVVKWLVEKGAEVNAKDNIGHTPLHYAARDSKLDVVKWLVEKGAEVNAKDWEGRTALHYAARFGHLDVVKWLVEKGAEVNAKDWEGRTTLRYAAHLGHLDVVTWLVEKGAEVNTKDNIGHTPLHGAARAGHLEVVTWLVEKGAEVNAKDNIGHTPLHGAGHLDVVKWLVEKGAEVNAKDNLTGQTVLHYAARFGYLDVVKWLVEKGAEVNAKDWEGRTAMDMASTPAIRNFLKDKMQKLKYPATLFQPPTERPATESSADKPESTHKPEGGPNKL